MRGKIADKKLICNRENVGYGTANNQGIELSQKHNADYVMCLNTDAEISEDDTKILLDIMRRNPDIGILGPALVETSSASTSYMIGGRDIALKSATRISVARKAFHRLKADELMEPNYVPGTVFLVRAEAFTAAGGFDPDYFFSGEAADLCTRMRRKGYRICVTSAALAHHDTRPHIYPHTRVTLPVL